MRVFGLTGGIASGKTTVAKLIAELGVPVVYADELARDAVRPGSQGLAAIVDAFGSAILDADGELDRKALGARVFADEDARQRLNAIVHPQVAALAVARFGELAAEGHALVCYEVPLLVEGGLQDAFRPVVVVAAGRARQSERTIRRDGLDAAEAASRLRAQLPLEEKLRVADFVIENDGTLEELRATTDEVLGRIRRSVLATGG